ncbi:MAG TPA: hypothetical protein IAA51_03755 [Candidatus Cottocaccamicrobium excrementipullorum]|nr:hypothetical protein [Candidatus Cottocaccamicrobium excrementipullorum]
MRGWLNYYGIADTKNNIESLNGWLYRRIREPYVRCCERTAVNHRILLDLN